MNELELNFYNRQIILKEIGLDGQRILNGSSVLIIGAGGLGSSAIQYLAASGIGTIGICDYDKLDISNLHRQVIYDYSQINLPKVESAKSNIQRFNPNITIKTYESKVSAENIEELISSFDVVLDCTDNFSTKFLIHDACYLNSINLVQASIYQFEGQMQVFEFSKKENSGCFRCLWPRIPEEGCVGTCGEVGVLGVVPGIFGTLQALEVIKLLLGWESLGHNQTFIFDLINLNSRKISWKHRTDCPLCGDNPIITSISDNSYDSLEEYELYSDSIEIIKFNVIDVREPNEINDIISQKYNFINLPFSKSTSSIPKLNPEKKYLFFCNHGIKSKEFAKILRQNGFKNVFSLKDGIVGINKLFE